MAAVIPLVDCGTTRFSSVTYVQGHKNTLQSLLTPLAASVRDREINFDRICANIQRDGTIRMFGRLKSNTLLIGLSIGLTTPKTPLFGLSFRTTRKRSADVYDCMAFRLE
jgi:hypothetical protein